MATSPVIMFIVTLVIEPASAAEPAMALVLAGIAVGLAVASLTLPSRLVADRIGGLELKLEGSFGERTIREDPDDVIRRASSAFMTAFLISVSLAEAIAILGVVAAFLGFAVTLYLPFLAFGFILILVRFPRYETMVKQVETAAGARFGPR